MPASSGILAIGVIAVLLIFFLAWRRPTLALTVWLIFSTVFSEYILLPDAPILHVHLSRVLLTALLLGLAAGWIPRNKRPDAPVNPAILIVILTAWTIVSAFWTGTIFRVDATRNLSVFLTGFFVPGIILYFARYFPLSLKVSRSVCGLLTLLLGYMVFTAFCEHFHVDSLVFPQYILDPSLGIHTERARGPIVNAAENGGMIAILLLAGLHTVLYASTSAMRWVGCAGLLLFGVLALWFTETRGPWLAFAGGLLVMLLHKQCRGLVLALGGVGGIALAVFLVSAAVSVGNLAKKDPLPQRSDNTSDTAEFRMDLYRESVRPFQEHPLAGWGLGTFTDTDYLFDAYGGSLTITTAVLHDTVVAITLESGIIGGVLYLSFLVTLTAALIRLRRASLGFETRDFYTLGLASLAVFVINGLFVDIRYFMQQNALVFLIAGLGLALPPRKALQVAEPSPR
jgi:putative inorganic carbon (hco3(-)) transporter